jgi:hypothetical protein
MTLEQLQLELVVNNHYGNYQGEVLAERLGHLLTISKEDLAILQDREHEEHFDVFDEAISSTFMFEGEEWMFYIGECADIFICKVSEFNQLEEE